MFKSTYGGEEPSCIAFYKKFQRVWWFQGGLYLNASCALHGKWSPCRQYAFLRYSTGFDIVFQIYEFKWTQRTFLENHALKFYIWGLIGVLRVRERPLYPRQLLDQSLRSNFPFSRNWKFRGSEEKNLWRQRYVLGDVDGIDGAPSYGKKLSDACTISGSALCLFILINYSKMCLVVTRNRYRRS
jgi:hypothetical protein